MQISLHSYISKDSPIHRSDTRVKFVLLIAYSATLFFVRTWTGLLVCLIACLAACVLARLPLKTLFSLLLPLYILLLFVLLFNSFSFDNAAEPSVYGLGQVSAGVFQAMEPMHLIRGLYFIPAGFSLGCFYSLRILLLVLASLVLSLSSTSNELVDALIDFMAPLRRVRVPVDDVAMIVSIALRFIPLTAEELTRVQAAQQSRGARFSEGGPIRRIKAWQPVLIPLFVGLFRRADTLATAMDSRCYGMSEARSRLHPRAFTLRSFMTMSLGLGLCFACGFFL